MTSHGSPKEKGSIFILVLWTLFMLAALAVVLQNELKPRVSIAGRLKQKAISYYAAKASIDRTRKKLSQDLDATHQSLNQWWHNGNYGLIDEESKININRAPVGVLRNVFEIGAKMDSDTARQIAESIIDWRDPDNDPSENGAESDYYKKLYPPYKAKNRDFQLLEELQLVKGMTAEIFEQMKGYLTVYGPGTVNINTAGKVPLMSLGLSEDLVDRIIRYREGKDQIPGTADDPYFEVPENIPETLTVERVIDQGGVTQLQRVLTSNWLSTRSDNFSGISEGTAPGVSGSTKIRFVVNRGQTILYLREE